MCDSEVNWSVDCCVTSGADLEFGAMVSRSIQADHKDLIHDIAYDYYGRRLATCSSDQSVKVSDVTTKSVCIFEF